MIISSKNISLMDNNPFNVVVNGNTESKTIIILVHGFGVRSESRGLFSSIENEFKDNFLTIRADFAEMERDYIRAIPISSQVKRLNLVIDYVKKEFPLKKLIFIGHSQGCIVISQAQLANCQILLLAPPIESPYENFINSAGWKYPGSHLDLNGESKLLRSDKTLILVDSNYWDDFKQINAKDLYFKLNNQNNVSMILASNDHVRGKQTIPNGMKGFFIEKANHDFKGEPRSLLLNKLKDIILV
jgi:hypothetical protein